MCDNLSFSNGYSSAILNFEQVFSLACMVFHSLSVPGSFLVNITHTPLNQIPIYGIHPTKITDIVDIHIHIHPYFVTDDADF